MLTELQTLQGLIKQLSANHQQAKQQLLNLQAKPMVDASELDSVKAQLASEKSASSDLKRVHDDIMHELKKLQKQLDEKTAECDRLTQQVAALSAEKDDLLAKNDISSQRAQTILERLSALDKS